MKKLIRLTAMTVGLALAMGTVTAAFAQDQKDSKDTKKKKGKKKKDDSKKDQQR